MPGDCRTEAVIAHGPSSGARHCRSHGAEDVGGRFPRPGPGIATDMVSVMNGAEWPFVNYGLLGHRSLP